MLDTKIPPPLVTALSALLMWLMGGKPDRSEWQTVVAIAFITIGLGLMLAALITFIKIGTTVNPLKPHRTKHLVISGVFNWSRNPIYLGDLLILCGWLVWLGNPVAVIVLPAFVAYINRFQIRPEEAALKRLFAQAYQDYSNRVRRWL
jgi:protein-S-isoprenylcysteine O-methyltransferase Ste14